MINRARGENVVRLPKGELELLIEQWLADLQVGGKSPKTRQSYRSTWSLFMRRTGILTVQDLDLAKMKQYMIDLEDGGLEDQRKSNSAATRHLHYRNFRAFFGWALDLENPPDFHSSLIDHRTGVKKWFRLPEPTVDEEDVSVFFPKEIAALEQAARRHVGALKNGHKKAYLVDRRYLVFMHTLLGTGMRIDEALRLQLEDLEENPYVRPDNDDAAAFLRVRKSKTHKPRAVPVSAKLYRDLLGYIRERPQTSSRALFVDDRGQPLQPHAPQQYFERLSRRVGIHVHAHKFRHTFATDFLRKNPNDIERLRLILGHRDYKMIKRYVAFNLEMLGANWNQAAPY